MFNDTGTLGSYISLRGEFGYFPPCPTCWRPPAAQHVAMGLRTLQDQSVRFANFIRIPILIRIIEREAIESEFAHAYHMSFLPLLGSIRGALLNPRALT